MSEPQLTITIKYVGTRHSCRAEYNKRQWLEKHYSHLTTKQVLHEFVPEVRLWMDQLFDDYAQYRMKGEL